jgi:glycosyltransferase involved in cell wall biosynthesis
MRAEVEMLRRAGDDVELMEADNATIDGTMTKIAAASSLFHSSTSSRSVAQLLQAFRPDILHVHNWFPLISPSIISVATEAGVPVVQTLHNYRMICANGLLYRDGKVCDDCVGKAMPFNGMLHGCYSHSRVGSALVSVAFSYHRLVHTWDGISTFIAVSTFQRGTLVRGGVNPAQIVVKPNFVRDPGGAGDGSGGYALFAGRLAEQKGIRTVIEAWEKHAPQLPLRIMGDGPLVDEVRGKAALLPQVQYLGQRSASEVLTAMAGARFLIFSSESYEPLPLTVLEAFSRGTPVLAADLESIDELVKDGKTGLRFNPGDPRDLAAKSQAMVADLSMYQEMRRKCRAVYEERYTEQLNYKMLIHIYAAAIESSRSCLITRSSR